MANLNMTGGAAAVLLVLVVALYAVGVVQASLWPQWAPTEAPEAEHDPSGRLSDVLEVARDKISSCFEAWNERDTAYLGEECLDIDTFRMVEPPPLPTMDAQHYLATLDQLHAAMPDARVDVLSPVLVQEKDDEGYDPEGETPIEGEFKFAYRWRFSGVFLEDVEWMGWFGRGQLVAYDAFSVGTVSWKRRGGAISVRMTEVRNYYSLTEVMLLFALPQEMDPHRGHQLEVNHSALALAEDDDVVAGQCGNIMDALMSHSDGMDYLLSPSVELWRPYPIRLVVRGVESVSAQLKNEMKTLNRRGAYRFDVLEHLSGSGNCVIEYRKSGEVKRSKRHDFWGFNVTYTTQDDDQKTAPAVEWEGVYELVLDADLRVAVIRDFFDPQEVSAQMGDFLEDVRDQWDTTTTTPSPAAAQVGLEGSGSDGGDHDEL